MTLVTFKIMRSLKVNMALMAGCGFIFGAAMNHCYKKQQQKIQELDARIDLLEEQFYQLTKSKGE